MTGMNASLQKQLRDLFATLPFPVTLAVFTKKNDVGAPCERCDETRQLVEELASMSYGKVLAKDYDVERDADQARLYGIDKAPAIAVLRGESGLHDFGIRFYGSPAGYEFGTLVEDIRMVSTGQAALSHATVEALSHLHTPLHIQVFVTPTCPYCPRAVLLAHRMAMVSERVTADMVDAAEFPELADRYQVHGVPRTVINETVHVEGAVPEAMLMAQLIPILEASAAPTP